MPLLVVAHTLSVRFQEHEANRQGWNEGAESYAADQAERIEFLRAGGTNFCPPEYKFLQNLEDWCGRAIHMQCAGGTDTLSLWNLGAHEVVGVDISDKMIELARAKAQALGAPARFLRCDILDTPPELDETADLVYTGRGAINWIMDIHAWAKVAARLLKHGGKLYVYEGHPFAGLFKLETEHFEFDPEWGDYFSTEVHADSGWPDTYIGDLGKAKEEHSVKYERNWPISTIINALLDAGLVLERFEEHPDEFWEMFPNVPEEERRRIPHTFSLLMRKPLSGGTGL